MVALGRALAIPPHRCSPPSLLCVLGPQSSVEWLWQAPKEPLVALQGAASRAASPVTALRCLSLLLLVPECASRVSIANTAIGGKVGGNRIQVLCVYCCMLSAVRR